MTESNGMTYNGKTLGHKNTYSEPKKLIQMAMLTKFTTNYSVIELSFVVIV